MPPFRLFTQAKGSGYFGVKRFDRLSGNRRLHMHTFANLIHSNFRVPSTDYEQLIQVTALLTRNPADVNRAFRRAVFNVAAHNRDDHAKNFAFLMDRDGSWTLSPAYDLIYSAGPAGEHTMTVAGEGQSPDRSHLLDLAQRIEIDGKSALEMIERVNAALMQVTSIARDAGCRRGTLATLRRAICPI